MKVPQTILIDTNIFDQNNYHFSSKWVTRFVTLATANKTTLLLPDPIEWEVTRHIKEGSRAAQAALQKACNDASLLYRWPKWYPKKTIEESLGEVEAATLDHWATFLKNFTIERLDYKDISLPEIMDWYDQKQPPFGEGEKRKEFPDAFTIAAALVYAKREDLPVAVISDDSDVRKACLLHDELVHFPSLQAITEALVDEAVKTAAIKAAIATNPAPLTAGISVAFTNLSFYHEEDLEAEVEDVEVESVDLSNVRVISIEDGNCTIAFDAEVEFSAYVEYGDPDTMIIDSSEDIRMPLFIRAGTVTETVSLSATAFLDLDEEWKEVLSVCDVELDKRNIGVETRPPIRPDDDDPPEDLDDPPEPPEPDDLQPPDPPEPPELDDFEPPEPPKPPEPDDSGPPPDSHTHA
jgi:hypothetical protein